MKLGSKMKPMQINGYEIVVLECYTKESLEAIKNGTGVALEWGSFSWEHNEAERCIKQGPTFDNYPATLQSAIDYVAALIKAERAA